MSMSRGGGMKGALVSTRAPDHGSLSLPPPGRSLPTLGHDLNQVIVLPRAEWERIEGSLKRREIQEEMERAAREERAAMLARSKEITQKWTNTLEAQRDQKLAAFTLRKEQEEEARKRLDVEEAKFQAEQRRQALERARTLQYHQTERVRGLHSALQLTETLKEREAQLELKGRVESARRSRERDWVQASSREREEAQREEERRAAERAEVAARIAEAQKQQVEEQRREVERALMEAREETREMERLARTHMWEQRVVRELRERDKKDIMKAHREHMAVKESLRAKEQERQAEEDKRIRVHSAAKHKINLLKRQKEEEILREQLAQRERATELLAAHIQQRVNDEDERVARAVAEQDAHCEQEQRKKDERAQAARLSIAQHRQQTMKEKAAEQRAERQRALEELRARTEADLLFAESQRLKEQHLAEESRQLKDVHVEQMTRRRAAEEAARRESRSRERRDAELAAEEERRFQEYALRVIDAARTGGRNPLPLVRAAAAGGQGPPLPGRGAIRADAQEVKELYSSGDVAQDKKRLGFVW
ncbi:cilia- and flagella- associated protein 210 [Lethenteron reissneri]|uniref:cilia- and flagella- associated protein 210 n=1 Tax=Lethenteron reissneri TaxID=7753 RepID=UPI002AB72394|nr:cilia- and flagella- associated protein 210 [Lethenteron reissneri]